MKIGIVGLGVVGSANRQGFEKLGHEVSWHDPKFSSRIEDVLDSEIAYLCVPTPQLENGKCDTSVIESVVAELTEKRYRGIIAVKSTVEPGTTRRLQERYDNGLICHVPEFLRERAALLDFTDNHDVCIIGTDDECIFDKIKESHGHFPRKFVRLSPLEAEFCKYFNNVYNAMLVMFANGMYELCAAKGADYTRVKNAMVERDHILDRYLDCNENLRGFGGMCLPKDTSALAALIKELGLPIKLFEAIVSDNKIYKTTVFEGMRD